jgi:hypothetical protein
MPVASCLGVHDAGKQSCVEQGDTVRVHDLLNKVYPKFLHFDV